VLKFVFEYRKQESLEKFKASFLFSKSAHLENLQKRQQIEICLTNFPIPSIENECLEFHRVNEEKTLFISKQLATKNIFFLSQQKIKKSLLYEKDKKV
jgi:hypothetical protein